MRKATLSSLKKAQQSREAYGIIYTDQDYSILEKIKPVNKYYGDTYNFYHIDCLNSTFEAWCSKHQKERFPFLVGYNHQPEMSPYIYNLLVSDNDLEQEVYDEINIPFSEAFSGEGILEYMESGQFHNRAFTLFVFTKNASLWPVYIKLAYYFYDKVNAVHLPSWSPANKVQLNELPIYKELDDGLDQIIVWNNKERFYIYAGEIEAAKLKNWLTHILFVQKDEN